MVKEQNQGIQDMIKNVKNYWVRLPWQSNGYDIMLPTQGARVQSLVRN